jgi:predicted anti-sigma-YlaC factor YlaD
MTDSNEKAIELDCIHALEFLYAYLDGELDDPTVLEKVEHHLGHCKSCYSRSEVELALAAYARKSQAVSPPKRLQKRLKSLLEKL